MKLPNLRTRLLPGLLLIGLMGGSGEAREIKPPWRYEPGQFTNRLRQAWADRWSQTRLVPRSFRRDPEVERASATVRTEPLSTQLWWWTVPGRARKAARDYATQQGKKITRVVRVVEPDGKAHFDIYARSALWETRDRSESLLLSVDDVQNKAQNAP